ncbi:MAG: DUF4469 domain-containing protein [Treponema sp.]|jgi:hypothetical protein|nr:DUF4469 domain-containing protein [Treponema sp.]
MASINQQDRVLHHIRVKLYPNYLLNVEGAYIARTDNEASLSIEEICVALKTRGGFTGSYDELVEHVKQFFAEAAYQLCDGFAVNTGYFSIYPNVGGSFNRTEGHDAQKHPVTFRFRPLAPLRALAKHIVIDIEGVANVSGYIAQFIDIKTGSVNDALTPGGVFSIVGRKIKIVGNDPEIGVYFVSTQNSDQRVKVVERFIQNMPSKLIGIVPELSAGTWKAEIKTQFSGSGSTTLLEPRVIVSEATLTVLG